MDEEELFSSSGSNAPMFMSHFFDDDFLLDHNMERMESGLLLPWT